MLDFFFFFSKRRIFVCVCDSVKHIPWVQQYVNRELPDVQAGFRKGRGTRAEIPTSAGSSKKQEGSRKTSISALLTVPEPLTVWITIN